MIFYVLPLGKKEPEKQRHCEQVSYSEVGADIALLRLVTEAPELKHAELGEFDQSAASQAAHVIGTPVGSENSISAGQISSLREFGRLYDDTIPIEIMCGGTIMHTVIDVSGARRNFLKSQDPTNRKNH